MHDKGLKMMSVITASATYCMHNISYSTFQTVARRPFWNSTKLSQFLTDSSTNVFIEASNRILRRVQVFDRTWDNKIPVLSSIRNCMVHFGFQTVSWLTFSKPFFSLSYRESRSTVIVCWKFSNSVHESLRLIFSLLHSYPLHVML